MGSQPKENQVCILEGSRRSVVDFFYFFFKVKSHVKSL